MLCEGRLGNWDESREWDKICVVSYMVSAS